MSLLGFSIGLAFANWLIVLFYMNKVHRLESDALQIVKLLSKASSILADHDILIHSMKHDEAAFKDHFKEKNRL